MSQKKRKNNKISVSEDVKRIKIDPTLEKNQKAANGSNSLVPKAQRKDLSEPELTALRAEIKRKQKASMEYPKMFLQLEEEGVLKRDGVAHISTTDLQHLIMYTLQKNEASVKANWCRFLRHNKLHSTLLVIIDDVTASNFHQHQESFPFLCQEFPMKVHYINPGEYNMKVEEELFSVAMSHRQLILNKTIGVKKSSDEVSRLDLMLDPFEMMILNYLMPFKDYSSTHKFKYTSDEYRLPSNNSAMFAIDCEMVETDLERQELAWVCVVDEGLKVVYESLVLPKGNVTNYLTKYSGISAETMSGVTTRLKDVQKALRNILPPDAILVGQSLNFDLKVLKMYHPFVIDTSCIFNLSGHRFKKPKLQLLSSLFLKRDIQRGGEGHDPREDAEAAMQLVQLKLEKGLQYGDVLQGWRVEELEGVVDGCEAFKDGVVDDSRFIESGGGVAVNTVKDLHLIKDETLHQDKESRLKAIFFRSSKFNMNLFQHFIAQNQSVSLVNFEKDLLGNGYEDSKDKLKVISFEEADDTSAMKMCRKEIKEGNNFLNVVKFSGTDYSEDCKKCSKRRFKDVDTNVKKLYKSLPEKCLIVVLLTGSGKGENSKNGLCFFKIKNELLS